MSDRVYDTLIEDGLVVDGTGNPAYRAHVGIRAGRIQIVRGDSADCVADSRIDARGKVVAPGFIDIHSHSDVVLLDNPLLEAKVRQGVTTEIVGVDGLSYAPFLRPSDLAAFAEQNGGIAGLPSSPLTWRSIGEQLEAYDGATAVNVGCFVGNAALRVNALGWGDDPADGAALANMRAMLREAMYDGAFGLSTGLDYPPGSHATTEEIVALAAQSAALGGIYHTHVRYGLGDTYLDPFREALEIAERAGSALQVTHFSRSSRATHPGGAQRMLDLLADAREDGIDVTFDTYTYEWGGTRLSRLLPMWTQVGGPAALRGRLTDPTVRARIEREITEGAAARQYVASAPFSDLRVGNLSAEPHVQFEGRFLSEIVVSIDKPLGQVVCELVLQNPAATFTRPSPHAMTLWKFVCHPLGMIASDSVFIGSGPSPRAYGCFSRVLAEFVREEQLLSLPEAVRKMTSMPAQRLGLPDRGLLIDGQVADVVVFDLADMAAPASFERPTELAVGMEHVLVGGVSVLRNGVMTGATPGRGLRSGAYALSTPFVAPVPAQAASPGR
ncbi:N-acyl-D-amino-acid deacylase family protein [Dactylosporangium sp. CA-233914]|uniref:N-acyl-D-amino-acid deacylase family protein n=1 Tax=Dactylosporangium sp. CA-233914 TaxID=3239934 RepID=UPI003D8DB77A